MTEVTQLSDKELSEAINFHRRQRNLSRGVNESANMRQTQMVRMLEAEEARRLEEAQVKKPTASERSRALPDGEPDRSADMKVNKVAYTLDKEPKKKVSLPKAPWNEEVTLDEASLLGPQGAIHKQASADQSDREYIKQMAFKSAWKAKNPGKPWPGYEKAGFNEEVEINEASYRDSGYRNMLKASQKADKEADKMRKKQSNSENKPSKPEEFKEETNLRVTKVYNKWPKKATYAVHTPDRKYFKEFDSMEAAKAHHAEKVGK